MTLVLAIDPGPKESGVVQVGLPSMQILHARIYQNDDLLRWLAESRPDSVPVIEQVASYGMAVGAEVFETCVWTGRFMQEWCRAHGKLPERMTRIRVKMALCYTARAKDAEIRARIIDLYGGNAKAAKGTKNAPGPLYGINSHLWAALALAIAWCEEQDMAKVKAGCGEPTRS